MKYLQFFSVLLLLLLAACSPAGGTEPPAPAPSETQVETVPAEPTASAATAVPTVEEPAPAEALSACPEPTGDRLLLQDAANGYCLLYPAHYQVVQTAEKSVNIVLDSLLNNTDPRFGLTIEAANGRTAVAIADEAMASYPADFGVERSSITVAGEAGELLDNVPGQDLYRRVLVVHEDRLYDFFISPVPGGTNAEGIVTSFYQGLMDSFTFVPVQAGAPLMAGPECPEATAETQLLRHEAAGYCLLYPAGYMAEQPSDSETVIFFGSMMDVEHPKLFIEVSASDGRAVYELADEVAAQAEGFELERTSGLLVDGEWAERIDNLPGQDINRQIIFIHNGRVYKLTFVPASPDAGEVYQQMEAMYALTLDSFNFLLP